MLKEKRDVCFELLRIIATLMVVIQHLLGHGGVLDSYNFICSGYIVFWHLDSLCYIAVNIFVLISGYFLIEWKFKPSKIVKLFIQVESYSVLILCISMLAFKHKPTINDLIWSIFPITGKAYWFCSVYMLLIFASPLLNILIRTYTKRQLIIINCFMLVIFSVIPTFMPWSRDVLTHGRDIIWFMTLYQVAAYIRIYVVTDDVHIKKKSIYYFFIYYVLASGGVLTRIALHIIGNVYLHNIIGTDILGKLEGLFYSYNSVLVLVESICFFMIFVNMRRKTRLIDRHANKICMLGKLSFAAYLISDNGLLREPLWQLINASAFVEKGVILTLIYALLISIAILILSCLIEWIRLKFVSLLRVPVLLQKIDIIVCNKLRV